MEIENSKSAPASSPPNVEAKASPTEEEQVQEKPEHVVENITVAKVVELAEVNAPNTEVSSDIETTIATSRQVENKCTIVDSSAALMTENLEVVKATEESVCNVGMHTKECPAELVTEVPMGTENLELVKSAEEGVPTHAPASSNVSMDTKECPVELVTEVPMETENLEALKAIEESVPTHAPASSNVSMDTKECPAELVTEVPMGTENLEVVKSAEEEEGVPTHAPASSNVSMDTKECPAELVTEVPMGTENLKVVKAIEESVPTHAPAQSNVGMDTKECPAKLVTEVPMETENCKIPKVTEESVLTETIDESNDCIDTKKSEESQVLGDSAREEQEGVRIVSNVLLTPLQPSTAEVNTTVDPSTTDNLAQSPALQSGLGLLAQYDSDDDAIEKLSDTESVVEVPVTGGNRDYRQQVVEIDSNIDSDSDSDSTDSDSEPEYLKKMRKVIDKSCATVKEEDDDDDDDESGMAGRRIKQPPKVKGELMLDDLPPIQDLHITVPEEECVELGTVHSIVEQLVLVSTRPDSLLLNLDTVLFLEKGKRVLGEIFDVLGQVADPLYCVRFNSQQQIEERGIRIGDKVYVAPKTEYTQFVILSSMMRYRGSDASWENDVEPPSRYLDYSDDEQERAARAKLRGKDRASENDDLLKRARPNENSDTESMLSVASSTSSSTSTQPRGGYRRGERGRGGGAYRNPHYSGPRQYLPPGPPRGYDPNFNAGSWHSNYYPPYRSAAPSNYHMPPHAPPPLHMPPPSHAYHGHSMYTSPPPSVYGPPYRQMPPPPYHGTAPQTQTPPMYVLNPYAAIRSPVLQPPPPPPPGAQ